MVIFQLPYGSSQNPLKFDLFSDHQIVEQKIWVGILKNKLLWILR